MVCNSIVVEVTINVKFFIGKCKKSLETKAFHIPFRYKVFTLLQAILHTPRVVLANFYIIEWKWVSRCLKLNFRMKLFKKSRSLLEVSYLYYFHLKRYKFSTKGGYSRTCEKNRKEMAPNQGFIFEIYQKIPTLFLLTIILIKKELACQTKR